MIVIPAIDLKDGKCVRLKQGKIDNDTIYSEKPFEVAKYFEQIGVKRLHIVDLNGAFKGEPENIDAIKEIISNTNLVTELGGGIRDLKTIEFYLNLGVDFIILGTIIVENFKILEEACKNFPGKIIAGIDGQNGKVAIKGWTQITDIDVITLSKKCESVGIREIIYTDISRDGMQTGVNVEATKSLQDKVKVPVIASGGVNDINDILKLKQNNIYGVITGRAIYENTLDLKEALRVCADD